MGENDTNARIPRKKKRRERRDIKKINVNIKISGGEKEKFST